MALKSIYESSYEVKYWFDTTLKLEGWFDQEYIDAVTGDINISGDILEGSDVVNGSLSFIGEAVQPYIFAPYVPPRRKLTLKKKKEEVPVVEVFVGTPLKFDPPVEFKLDVEKISDAINMVNQSFEDFEELKTLIQKERKKKRRKRMIVLMTIQ